MVAWVVLLIGLLVLAMYILTVRRGVEPFVTVDLNTATAQRQGLQFEGERRYNNFARLQGTNSFIPADQVDAALQQVVPVPTSGSHSLLSLLGFTGLGAADDGSNKQGAGVEQTGMVQEKINFCESQTTVNCALLDDPRFAECGFCHRDGVNSKGKAHRGGMYISSDDQIRANEVSNANGQTPAVYAPTIGTCKSQNFTLMNENCQVRELQMQCQRAGAATSANACGQCYGSAPAGTTGLLYMGTKPRTYTAILWVSHPGSHSNGGAGLTVQYANGSTATLAASSTPLFDPQRLTLEITEGDNLVITVYGVPSVWCGWLSSPDGNRTVSLDIGEQSITPASGFVIAGDKRAAVVNKMLASSPIWPAWQTDMPNTVLWYQRRDEVVPGAIVSAWYGNTLPSSTNAQGIDVTDYLKMAATGGQDIPVSNQYFQTDPAPNIPKHLWITQDNGNVVIAPETGTVSIGSIANAMAMNFTVPATLVDPLFAEDKTSCPSGPIVFTEVGAGLMGAHSCFKADGSFNPSLYCIRELFQAAGGTPQGRIYPTTDAQAAAMALNDPTTGKPSLDATVAAFNNGVNIAMYGVDMNGAIQEFQVIKDNALDFLGVVMNNPCDGPNVQTGPHSPECLDYLWRTSGNPGQDVSQTDPSKLPYAYCNAAGQAAPLNADGTVNQSNATTANSYGAIPNVRAFFQGIFNRSQDSSDFDKQAAAMQACFNVNIQPPPEDPSVCPPPNPDDWQCFGPTKLAQPEVYYTSPNGYATTLADAPALCGTYGGRVATTAEITAAQQQGANWCGAGWVSDSPANALYPMNVAVSGCGNAVGVIQFGSGWLPSTDSTGANKTGQGNPSTAMAGVNCYGKKPPMGTPNITPFNTATNQWNNPNALPPGISATSVIVGNETANAVYCGTATGNGSNSCMTFDSEGECDSYLAGKNVPSGSMQIQGQTSSDIDQYVRARV